MSKQPPLAPTASTIGSCPTITQIVGRHGTESSPWTIAPPGHPRLLREFLKSFHGKGKFDIYFCVTADICQKFYRTFLSPFRKTIFIPDLDLNYIDKGVVGWCDGAG